MPRTCTICRHDKRAEIDEALLSGESLRNIAKRSGTSSTALFRHRNQHIPTALAKVKEVEVERQSETLFDRLRTINRETGAILKEARAANSPSVALSAINRIERQIELEAKILGQLDESIKVAVGFDLKQNDAEMKRQIIEDLSVLSDDELNAFIRLKEKLQRRG